MALVAAFKVTVFRAYAATFSVQVKAKALLKTPSETYFLTV